MIHSVHLQKDADADKSDELAKVSPGETEQDSGVRNYRKDKMHCLTSKVLGVRKYTTFSGE